MLNFETTALMTADHQPTIWKQYVDDTFVIWPHGREKLEYFLHHINHLHKDITFTVEVEEDHKIAFLDVQIIRNNSTLETLVYCIPTHTNQYLNFRSHHHPRVKFGIIQCLTQRARKICSKDHKEGELKLLKEVFIANGYPEKKVTEVMNREPRNKEKNKEDEGKNELLLILPYIQGLSEKITRTCTHFNIKTAFTARPTLRNLLVQVKGKPPPTSRLGVVYCIPCNCGRTYIGETGRSLSVRISEHKRAVQQLDRKNALAVHMTDHMDHQILWEESIIKEYETNWYRRKIKEAIWIRQTANALNTDSGLSLNVTWNTMLPKPTSKEETGRQNDPEIDEEPSRLSTPRAAVTATSLDTK